VSACGFPGRSCSAQHAAQFREIHRLSALFRQRTREPQRHGGHRGCTEKSKEETGCARVDGGVPVPEGLEERWRWAPLRSPDPSQVHSSPTSLCSDFPLSVGSSVLPLCPLCLCGSLGDLRGIAPKAAHRQDAEKGLRASDESRSPFRFGLPCLCDEQASVRSRHLGDHLMSFLASSALMRVIF
jgi:hypothetical protein